MPTKLSTITTQYRRFTKNQVLTEVNLNEVVDFFDDQDRLTRIYLSGVGIVCGFTVSLNNTQKTITVSQGTGITTDGDLFKLYNIDDKGQKVIDFPEKVFQFCKKYDNSKAKYKPFFYSNDKQLPIFELLTDEQQKNEKEENFSINDFKNKTNFDIQDAVVILYLESYEKELDLCVSLSCDNQGLETIGNYKILIVSKEVAAQINSHDSIISKINYQKLYYQLPEIRANRIVMKLEDFIDFETLKKSFAKEIFKNNVVDNLKNGYTILLKSLKMPQIFDSITKNLDAIFNFQIVNAPNDFQYRYDLLNDIIATYNETKNLLFNIESSSCNPDLTAFPRHLMLGETYKTNSCFEFRHGFYKSSLLTEQNLGICKDCLTSVAILEKGNEKIIEEKIVDSKRQEINICFGENTAVQKLGSLIKRTAQLLENFNSNYNTIKITPTLQLGILGHKAIPFYNNVGNELINVWDFDKTVLGKQRENVSYHDNLLNTKNPLQIHFDNDFYRIEGHQGRNYKEALNTIQKIRRENGLGFNVVLLAVNPSNAEKTKQQFTQYYLQKNHGYEHKAGVPPGGTFIMIYIEEEQPYYYSSNNNGPSLTGDFENRDSINEVAKVENPIVADFMLPYLCCDENDVSLSLPKDKICFDNKTVPLPFKVSPKGGFIKANVNPSLNAGITVDSDGNPVLDPKLVSTALIGKRIRFTVNNIDTDCVITLFRKPEFKVISKIIGKPGITQTTIEFSVFDTTSSTGKYSWDFGDGTTIIITDQTTISHTYNYQLTNSKKIAFNVIIVGTSGECSLEVVHPVLIEIANSTISLDKKTFCRNDRLEYAFTVTPPDSTILIEGAGVSRNSLGNFIFIPSNVPSTINSILFKVNGEDSNLTITITNVPIASFSTIIDSTTVTFNNLSQNAQKYVWKIDQETIVTDSLAPISRPLSKYNNEVIEVSLLAESNLCGERLDGPRKVALKKIEPENTCLDTATQFIEDSLTTIKKLKSSPAFARVNDQFKLLTTTVEEQLLTVNSSAKDFINGKNNGVLPKIFSDVIFAQFKSAFESQKTIQEIATLRLLVKIYTSLYYTILRCQKPSDFDVSKKIIQGIDALFAKLFSAFVVGKFNADKDSSLKQFLTDMLTVFVSAKFILEDIKKLLNELKNGEQF